MTETQHAHSRSKVFRRIESAGLILCSAVTITLLWWTEIPLGIPGEWTWPRIAYTPEHVFGWIIAGMVSVPFYLFFWIGSGRIGRVDWFEKSFWLTGAFVCACVWIWFAEAANPVPLGHSRDPLVVYYPRTSGYFYEAKTDRRELGQFLAEYEAEIKKGDYLHIGTHPPGLTILLRGLRVVCLSPGVRNFLISIETESIRLAFNEMLLPSARISATDRAAIHLWILLVNMMAALTLIPMFFLGRAYFDDVAAWRCIAFWPLVPSLCIFLPKSDVLFPAFAVGMICLWNCSLTAKHMATKIVTGLIAGGLFFVSIMMSLAFLTIAVMAGVLFLLHAFEDGVPGIHKRLSGLSIAVISAGLAFLASTVIFSTMGQINLPEVWYLNYQNHGRFYDFNDRTYFVWLLVNPMELMFAVGLPVVFLTVTSTIRNRSGLKCHMSLMLPWLIVWGILWITGKNMGEGARLWNLLLPFVVLSTAGNWASRNNENSSVTEPSPTSHSQPMMTWGLALAIQIVVCLATATRIDGFDLSEFLS